MGEVFLKCMEERVKNGGRKNKEINDYDKDRQIIVNFKVSIVF